jgi:exodeoxyribonuclease VII large subunit
MNSFSLYELNQHLRRVISFNMKESVWIRAEISDYKYNKGIIYLSLVDRDDFQLKAKSNAIIWPKDIENIKKNIGDGIWTILQVGQQILIEVLVEFSELHGLSLIVKNLDLSFSIGQLELQRAATLKRLEEEQFLELNKQLDFPLVPQRIAVISSKDAAGLQDFLQHLHHNHYNYAFKTELFQAAMQGNNLSSEVVEQIEIIETQSDQFDCIVIVRGGGAKLDLMGFDDYNVCKAIATSELPVLTGIGHDINETLSDIVAKYSMKTPTAVADFLVQRVLNFEMELNKIAIELKQNLQHRLKNEEIILNSIFKKIELSSKLLIQKEKQFLELLENQLELMLPDSTLERGFTLIYDSNGIPVNSVRQLSQQDEILIRFKDGEVKVKIEFI